MPTLENIFEALDRFAPVALAESWDNVGMLAGDPKREITRVLAALDITSDVINEAGVEGCELIVSHHPLISHPVLSVTAGGHEERLFRLLSCGMGAICMHTNLDTVSGGVNDCLAQTLGLRNIEAVCDVLPFLRMGEFEPLDFPAFLRHVKNSLGCDGLRFCGGGEVKRVAVGGGSCGDMWERVLLAGCDTFVTSDVKYHDFLDIAEAGLNIIDAGHFPTENPVVGVIAAAIREAYPSLEVLISKKHLDKVRFYF